MLVVGGGGSAVWLFGSGGGVIRRMDLQSG